MGGVKRISDPLIKHINNFPETLLFLNIINAIFASIRSRLQTLRIAGYETSPWIGGIRDQKLKKLTTVGLTLALSEGTIDISIS